MSMLLALTGFAFSQTYTPAAPHDSVDAERLQAQIDDIGGGTAGLESRMRIVIGVLNASPTAEQLQALIPIVKKLESDMAVLKTADAAQNTRLDSLERRPTVDMTGVERQLTAINATLNSRLTALETAQKDTTTAVRGVSITAAGDDRSDSPFFIEAAIGAGGRFRGSTISDSGLVTPGPAGGGITGNLTLGVDIDIVEVGIRARGGAILSCGLNGGLDLVVGFHPADSILLYGVGGYDTDMVYPGIAARVGGGVKYVFSEHIVLSGEAAYLSDIPDGTSGMEIATTIGFLL